MAGKILLTEQLFHGVVVVIIIIIIIIGGAVLSP
jgi:hypothetical protein